MKIVSMLQMTQLEMFGQQQTGNLTREVPLTVGRIAFSHALPDMRGQPPANGTATSIAAADAIKASADTLRKRVFDYIKARGPHGATDEEAQAALGMSGNTQRPRRVELFQQGKICMSTEMRRTRAGRKANVWVTA